VKVGWAMNKNIIPTFDYSSIDPGVAGFIQRKKAVMIHRSVVNIVADGRDLLAIRQALGSDAAFREWVGVEYWFSYVTAQKRMHVAEMVDAMDGVNPGLPQQFEDKTISELYELAATYRRPPGGENVGPALLSSGSQEWYTPVHYIEAAEAVMGRIDVDPASCAFANRVVQANLFYDKETNGLDKDWPGRVWLNPPYGYVDEDDLSEDETYYQHKNGQGVWSHRLIAQYEAGITAEAMLHVNANTRFLWFHPLWAYPVCLVDHSIRFYNEQGVQAQATNDSAFVYMGPEEKWALFYEQFSPFGRIVWPEQSLVLHEPLHSEAPDNRFAGINLDDIDLDLESTYDLDIAGGVVNALPAPQNSTPPIPETPQVPATTPLVRHTPATSGWAGYGKSWTKPNGDKHTLIEYVRDLDPYCIQRKNGLWDTGFRNASMQGVPHTWGQLLKLKQEIDTAVAIEQSLLDSQDAK